jgi:hypothetical protein
MIDWFDVLPLHGVLAGIAFAALTLLLLLIDACTVLGMVFVALWIARLIRNGSAFVHREIPRSTSITVANSQLKFEHSVVEGWGEAKQLMAQTTAGLAFVRARLDEMQQQINTIGGSNDHQQKSA